MGQECSPKPWLEARERWSWMEMLMGSQSRAPLTRAGVDTHPQGWDGHPPPGHLLVHGTNLGDSEMGSVCELSLND